MNRDGNSYSMEKDVDFHDLFERMLDTVQSYNPNADLDKLHRTFEFGAEAHAEQLRKSGEPFFVHGVTVASILADLRLDVDTLVAAMMHDIVEDTDFTLADVAEGFGQDVADMVDGVTKLSKMRNVTPETRRAENYRKLILAIAKDPRTVLIKLADRLHNMRTIEFLRKDRQLEISRETLDVYAPLAHRFGIAMIKWELEDRAFKVLMPERYFEIESGINQTRAERERLILGIRKPLVEAMRKAGIDAQITGRPKHFYSIYRKMQDQELAIERIYDLLALRIICGTKADCYHVLGVIHSLFPPISDRIKDYIASPKPNMYQSLHTTVKVPGDKYVEVQIRTREMHEMSEIGIAAHWRYKEDSRDSSDFSGLVEWLRQIMAWQEDVADPQEFMETLRIDFFQDEVFVFSPAGDLFQLPRGATPLDFAFRIHSEVGLHCVGAKVNGRIVSLRTDLQNRDVVEILTAKTARPSTSWLALVRTSRAKHHLRRWIKQTQQSESIKLGRDILERELARAHVHVDFDKEIGEVATALGYIDSERLLAAIGGGDLPYQRVVNRLKPEDITPAEKILSMGKGLRDTLLRRQAGGIRVAGEENLMVNHARCCQPVPGDAIIGVITRGRGVTVHRAGCSNLSDPALADRKIEVTWDAGRDQTFTVKLIVTAEDRQNLLADLGRVISSEGINIHSGEFGAENDLAIATILVDVANVNQLQRIIKSIRKVRGVVRVDRHQIS